MATKEETKGGDVQMVAASAKTEMVKVKCVRPFLHPQLKRVINPDEIVEVAKEDVPRLTERRPGTYNFVGSRRGADGQARHEIRYADIVA